MKKCFFCIALSIAIILSGCVKQQDSIFEIVPESAQPTAEQPLPTPEEAAELPAVEPTQTIAEPEADMPKEYSEGQEGSEISDIQIRLAELGYMKDDPTGYFGSVTKDAVSKFQKENGLNVTGIADSSFLKVLYSDSAVRCSLPLAGYVIGLDPGHQSKQNSDPEPVSPGSSETKKKVSSGTQGRFTGVPEYEVVLKVGLLLRDMLEAQGATVIMTRETHDVDISNAQRAQFFNDHKVDYGLRLHINGSDNEEKHGAFMLVPTKNPYLDDCKAAAQLLIDSFCEATGAKNLGLTNRSDQTGFNWCNRMIINIEMGHMTNRREDELLVDADYQQKMAQGLCNGIMEYFESKAQKEE